VTIDAIAAELPKLASLEHALCVEYLYAKFSIAAPDKARSRWVPDRWRQGEIGRYQARHEIFNIAVDEMRHFRWANEMLRLLDRPPTIARASVIGKDLKRNFARRALQPDVLDQFIAIEAPSSIYNDDPQQLDGMYTRILLSLHHISMPGREDLRLRLKQLVKTIIDEGGDHWRRFRLVKARLAGQKPASYLYKLADLEQTPKAPWDIVSALCDAYYALLLQALFITFMLGRLSRGDWLRLSRQAMCALDIAANFLVKAGYGPRFIYPKDWKNGVPQAFAHVRSQLHETKLLAELLPSPDHVDALFQPALDLIAQLEGQGGRFAAFAADQRRRMNAMRDAVKAHAAFAGDA
jgi:hypothetical protein